MGRAVDVRAVAGVLDVGNKVADANFQGFGNSNQRTQGNGVLAPLDFAEVLGIEIGKLRKFFLGQFRLPSGSANCFPEGLAEFRKRSHWSDKQARIGGVLHLSMTGIFSAIVFAFPMLLRVTS